MSQNPYNEARLRRRRGQPWLQDTTASGSKEYTLPLRLPNQNQQHSPLTPNSNRPFQAGLGDEYRSYYPAAGHIDQQHASNPATVNLQLDLNPDPGLQNTAYFEPQKHPQSSSSSETWTQYPTLEYDESTDTLPVQEQHMEGVQPAYLHEHSSPRQDVVLGPSGYPDASHDSDPSMDTRTLGEIRPERRLCCPFTIKDPHLSPRSAACWNTGFPNVSRLKQHLRRNHGIEISQQERNTTEEEKFENVWRELYPDYSGQIPSPYGWNRETLQRQQNLRVIEEHEEFIRVHFWQHCDDPQMGFVLEDILEAFRHLRRSDLLPHQV